MSTKNKVSTNPLKSEGTVTAGGKEYKLEFTMRGLAAAEEASGLQLLTLSVKQAQTPSAKMVFALFYELALKHISALTFDEVQDLIKPTEIAEMWGTLLEVHFSAFIRNDSKNA